MKTAVVLTALFLLTGSAPAQEAPPDRPRRPMPDEGGAPQDRVPRGPDGLRPPGPGQGTPREGPWNRNLHQAILTPDGKLASQGFFLQSAGVPDVVQDDNGRLLATFQWFPQGERELFDQVAISISGDGGKAWTTPRKVNVSGLPAGLRRPYDPTLTIPEAGRIRLYFTSHENPSPDSSAIYSALSTDGGETFVFEPGKRFGLDGAAVMDCAVAKLGATWHLICPQRGGGAVHSTSPDGLTFSPAAAISPTPGYSWIGNLTATGGKLQFWMGTSEGMLRIESTDGLAWSGAQPLELRGVDPAALPLPDNRTLLLFTGQSGMQGPPRAPGQRFGPPGEPPREPREPDVELRRDPPPLKP